MQIKKYHLHKGGDFLWDMVTDIIQMSLKESKLRLMDEVHRHPPQ